MFFERPHFGETAVLVHIEVANHLESRPLDEDFILREFELLSIACGASPCGLITAKVQRPHPKFFIRSGKIDEILTTIELHHAEIVIFNNDLSPSQERNLEKKLCCRVISRTTLILDIFSQRARSYEGKLQVELAQLEHISSRLIRGWTHLERQKGGIGLRGPGESQLETDRRLIRLRIRSLEKRLDRVSNQRNLSRKSRLHANTTNIALVGYTNAGKSSLFNQITNADVLVKDQLFATLDPTLRKLLLPKTGPIVIADTVGFISSLPHKLIKAFHATLEEATKADFLLHVIDTSNTESEYCVSQVNEVLEEINASSIPQIKIYNKIDMLDNVAPHIDYDSENRPIAVWVSSLTESNILLLKQAIASLVSEHYISQSILLPAQASSLRAQLHQLNAVVSETFNDDGSIHIKLRISPIEWQKIEHKLSKLCA